MLLQKQVSLYCLASFFGAPSRTLNPAILCRLVSRGLCIILLTCCCVLPTSSLQSQTWQWQNSGTGNLLNNVHFTDSQKGWAVGISGTIVHTSNGGQLWSPQNSGIGNQLNSVYFTDSQKGWAVGEFGTIVHTSNGGQVWLPQNSGTGNRLNSVHFTDNQNGWAVGEFGTIVHTSNGGQTWSPQNSGIGNHLNSVHFTDNQKGWAVGLYGTIVHTSNGGQAWSPQNSGIGNHLNSVHFTDSQNGWAVGLSGTILKYSAGTIAVSTISTPTTSIGEISPQPVGITFNINIFSPTDNQKATIGLFNAVGHVVFECSEILRADENTLTFPSEYLPPGIYFLTVQVSTAKKTLRVLKQ